MRSHSPSAHEGNGGAGSSAYTNRHVISPAAYAVRATAMQAHAARSRGERTAVRMTIPAAASLSALWTYVGKKAFTAVPLSSSTAAAE